jgi:hypothetical protein
MFYRIHPDLFQTSDLSADIDRWIATLQQLKGALQ